VLRGSGTERKGRKSNEEKKRQAVDGRTRGGPAFFSSDCPTSESLLLTILQSRIGKIVEKGGEDESRMPTKATNRKEDICMQWDKTFAQVRA